MSLLAACDDPPAGGSTSGTSSSTATPTSDPSTSASESSSSTGNLSDTDTDPSLTDTDSTTGTGSSTDTGDTDTDTDTDTSSSSTTGDPDGLVCDVDIVCTGDGVWQRQWGEAGHNASESVNTVDAATDGTITIGGAAGIEGGLSFGAAGQLEGEGAYVAQLDSDGNPLWSQNVLGLSDAGHQSRAVVKKVATAANGNVVALGSVSADSLVFGDTTLTPFGDGENDFLIGLDAQGEARFGRMYRSPSATELVDVAVRDDGWVVAVGTSADVVDWGEGEIGHSGRDVVLVQLEPDGSHWYMWVYRYDGDQDALSVTYAPDGDFVVAMTVTSGTLELDTNEHPSDEGPQLVLAKFHTDIGTPIWSRSITSSINRAELSADDEFVYLAASGNSEQTIDFGAGPTTGNGFVVSLTEDGDAEWSRGLSGGVQISDIATGPAGAVGVVGQFWGEFGIDGSTTPSAGGLDGFVLKMSAADGATNWLHTIGDLDTKASNTQQFISGISFDELGHSYVASRFAGTIDVGLGAINTGPEIDDYDALLLKLEP